MSDATVAQAARRFIYARTLLAHIQMDIHNADRDHDTIAIVGDWEARVEEERQRKVARRAKLRAEAVKAGAAAIDAFLDMIIAMREEDITIDLAHPDHN